MLKKETLRGDFALFLYKAADMLRRLDLCWKIKIFFHRLENSARIENRLRDDGYAQKKFLATNETTAFLFWNRLRKRPVDRATVMAQSPRFLTNSQSGILKPAQIS